MFRLHVPRFYNSSYLIIIFDQSAYIMSLVLKPFILLKFIFVISFIIETVTFRLGSTLSLRNRGSTYTTSDYSLYASDRIGTLETPGTIYEYTGNVITLSRFMIEATRANPDHADLESLIESIQIGCKTIANILSRSGISDLTAPRPKDTKKFEPRSYSPSSDNAMYHTASTVLKNALKFTGKVGVVTFDNEEHPVLIEEAWNSKYVAVFDPLDGASNIDVGIVTGTIFGIFQEDDECLVDYGENVSDEGQAKLLRNLQPGKNLVAAGYCMYSSSTVLMFSMGDGNFSNFSYLFNICFTYIILFGDIRCARLYTRSIHWRIHFDSSKRSHPRSWTYLLT